MAQDPIWNPMTASDAGRFVVSVVVCAGVTSQGAPINACREFHIGQRVYLVCSVTGIAEDVSHLLSVRWLLDGYLVQAAGSHSSALVMQSGEVSFSMIYSSPGVGGASVYWDEPVADNNDIPNDHFLAHTADFTIT
jgi:hypothetical protein